MDVLENHINVLMRNEVVALTVYLILGGIAGLLASVLMEGSSYGTLGNVIIGVVGAFIGGYVLNLLNVRIGYGVMGKLLTALLGACLLLAALNLMQSRKTR